MNIKEDTRCAIGFGLMALGFLGCVVPSPFHTYILWWIGCGITMFAGAMCIDPPYTGDGKEVDPGEYEGDKWIRGSRGKWHWFINGRDRPAICGFAKTPPDDSDTSNGLPDSRNLCSGCFALWQNHKGWG